MTIPSGTTPALRDPAEASDTLAVDWLGLEQLRTLEPACCCAGRPVVYVVLRPSGDRVDSVELLMCAHHARVSWRSLNAAGAFVFDASGHLLMPREPHVEWPARPAGFSPGCGSY